MFEEGDCIVRGGNPRLTVLYGVRIRIRRDERSPTALNLLSIFQSLGGVLGVETLRSAPDPS